jgi:CHAD domain-containing protein
MGQTNSTGMGDNPALRPRAAIGPALHAIAAHTLAQARVALAGPERSDHAAIHDFRRAMKQWRALLRLLAPFLDDARRWRDEARDRARSLAGARDAQSARNAFDDLVEDNAVLPERTVATIRSRLDAMRGGAEQAVLASALRQDILDWLDAADAATERWPFDAITFEALARRLARGYRAACRCVPADWSQAQAAEMHALRRRVVDHRYQMAMVEPLWPRFAKMWLEEAERLRDRLGKYQDLVMLEQLAGPHQPLARWRSRLMPLCAERKDALAKRASRVAARLFAERPKAFRQRLEALWERSK